MAILSLLMVGILQMFSLALLVNQGSSARTQMTYKAQQVVEQIRYVQWLRKNDLVAAAGSISAASGIPTVLAVNSTGTKLPYDGTPADQWAFWGPAGNNVMEKENGPYQISYTVAAGATPSAWIITVSANPVSPTGAAAGTQLFLGVGGAGGAFTKRIDYVAQIN
jgi:hypothetical protein